MSFFIFAESLVQRVYYPGRFIDPGGSKSLSVKSQFFRVHRTNDFPLLFYFAILVDIVQFQKIIYSRIQQAGHVLVLFPSRKPGFMPF
ncbi:MAG: hypothetical protein Q8927_06275 [Bacteroidota bacterium]|nr:hypothetical protein [Bacteroidota bacterium]MDP4215790.1 hypothetical protein [Bacteroidota bacterium]MDP4257643.1 hypothetical protein [Bacteroidota bacterium]